MTNIGEFIAGSNNLLNSSDLDNMPIDEVVDRIITLNSGLKDFWSNALGWASVEAASLLSKSRLDRQVSLSHCLRLWLPNFSVNNHEGCLILAWANLGSLIEGSMKLFLSAYYTTYKSDIEDITENAKIKDPDELLLEPLRQYFEKRIWDCKYNDIIKNIQHKRNSIHAFKDRDIGTKVDFESAVRDYLEILRYINYRLPYPNELYIPWEI